MKFAAQNDTAIKTTIVNTAYLLLQIRTRVLNDQLSTDFHRWYPNFTRAPDGRGPSHVAPLKSPVLVSGAISLIMTQLGEHLASLTTIAAGSEPGCVN